MRERPTFDGGIEQPTAWARHMSRLYLIIMALWLAAAVAFVAWQSRRVVYIGRMVLPREQAVALAVVIVVVVSLAALWLLIAGGLTARLIGLPLVPVPAGGAVGLAVFVLLPLAAGGTYAWGRHVEPKRLVVRTLALGEQREATTEPVRLAVISDLHVEGMREPWLSLAARINATRPDVILFLGDTLNRRAGLGMLRRSLADMRAPHKLAVRGNWDVWYWHDLDLLGDTGFTWVDGAVDLRVRGREVRLVGLAYADDEDGRRGEPLLRAAAPGAWRLFAYHTPDLVEQVPAADLYLAGHTHGGQVSIPGFGALVTLSRHGKRFERGAVQAKGTLVYTTPGVGVEPAVPLRIGVPPEVTLVLLGDAARP